MRGQTDTETSRTDTKARIRTIIQTFFATERILTIEHSIESTDMNISYYNVDTKLHRHAKMWASSINIHPGAGALQA